MGWVLPLLTLTLMEVVLGIDNIIFLSILVAAIPKERQKTARFVGLGLALVARMALLLGIKWVMGLSTALFHWSSIGWVPDGWVENHHVDAVTGRERDLARRGDRDGVHFLQQADGARRLRDRALRFQRLICHESSFKRLPTMTALSRA